jgi:beta-lactamase regulating signal transducer with metallopeptidase domain
MIVIWIIGVVVCVFALLLINLIILHVYLHCKGLTTYEFILIRKEEERLEEIERKAKEEEV